MWRVCRQVQHMTQGHRVNVDTTDAQMTMRARKGEAAGARKGREAMHECQPIREPIAYGTDTEVIRPHIQADIRDQYRPT